jgi:hypothetical protein
VELGGETTQALPPINILYYGQYQQKNVGKVMG